MQSLSGRALGFGIIIEVGVSPIAKIFLIFVWRHYTYKYKKYTLIKYKKWRKYNEGGVPNVPVWRHKYSKLCAQKIVWVLIGYVVRQRSLFCADATTYPISTHTISLWTINSSRYHNGEHAQITKTSTSFSSTRSTIGTISSTQISSL